MSLILDLMKKFPKAKVLVLTGSGALLGYMGKYAFTEIEYLGRQSSAMAARIVNLENDDAKWGTLAEQKKQLVELAIEVEVLKRTWFRRTLDGEPYEPAQTMPSMSPPPNPPPPSPAPFVKSPEEFRLEQSAKYPSRK